MKKYLIVLLGISAILNTNSSFAQSKSKKAVAGCPTDVKHHYTKHHAKKKPVKMMEETINLDDRFKTAVIEINKGNIYYNDSLISSVKNAKWEDHKIVVNYIVPPPPAPIPPAPPVAMDVDQLKTNSYTGNNAADGDGFLGVYTLNYFCEGAMIHKVVPCGPACKAGLHAGDVITRVNDKDIDNSDDLVTAIGSLSAGDNVSITYMHYGRMEKLDAELGKKGSEPTCNGCADKKEENTACYRCFPRRGRW